MRMESEWTKHILRQMLGLDGNFLSNGGLMVIFSQIMGLYGNLPWYKERNTINLNKCKIRLKDCRTLQPFKAKLLGSLSELPKKTDSMMSLGQFETHVISMFQTLKPPNHPWATLLGTDHGYPDIESMIFPTSPKNMFSGIFWFPGPGNTQPTSPRFWDIYDHHFQTKYFLQPHFVASSLGQGWEQNCHPNTGAHRIHVWYIYLHLGDFYGKCR